MREPDHRQSSEAAEPRPSGTRPQVVPDTNVFIAAHWNHGSASHSLLKAAEEGRVLLAMSEGLAAEIRHILDNIHARAEYREWVEALLSGAQWVIPWVRLEVVPDDPDDDKLLECALTAEADYIATNDDHLLQLQEFAGTLIRTPGDVVRALDPGPPPSES